MRYLFLLSVFAVAIPARDLQQPKKEANTIQEQLLGEWQIIQYEFTGQIEKPKTGTLTAIFHKDRIEIIFEGKPDPKDDLEYSLNVHRNPITIDLKPQNVPSMPGILRLERDSLTVCFSLERERPTQFAAPDHQDAILVQLKRIKK